MGSLVISLTRFRSAASNVGGLVGRGGFGRILQHGLRGVSFPSAALNSLLLHGCKAYSPLSTFPSKLLEPNNFFACVMHKTASFGPSSTLVVSPLSRSTARSLSSSSSPMILLPTTFNTVSNFIPSPMDPNTHHLLCRRSLLEMHDSKHFTDSSFSAPSPTISDGKSNPDHLARVKNIGKLILMSTLIFVIGAFLDHAKSLPYSLASAAEHECCKEFMATVSQGDVEMVQQDEDQVLTSKAVDPKQMANLSFDLSLSASTVIALDEAILEKEIASATPSEDQTDLMEEVEKDGDSSSNINNIAEGDLDADQDIEKMKTQGYSASKTLRGSSNKYPTSTPCTHSRFESICPSSAIGLALSYSSPPAKLVSYSTPSSPMLTLTSSWPEKLQTSNSVAPSKARMCRRVGASTTHKFKGILS